LEDLLDSLGQITYHPLENPSAVEPTTSSVHSPALIPNRALSALLFNMNITRDYQTFEEAPNRKKRDQKKQANKTKQNKTKQNKTKNNKKPKRKQTVK